MKKIISLLVCSYFLIGCSATHQAKVRERINSGKKENVKQKASDYEELKATSDVRVTSDAIADYIEQYKNVAMESMATYGIPASIKLAQAILESGSGKGTLARSANNHFGIKCQTLWSGEVVYHNDDAPNECFRKYDSAIESFHDHSLFLTSRAHYKSLFELDKNDYRAWAFGLKKAGYATDPNYPNKLISLIERYELYKYDAMVLGKDYSQKGTTYTYQKPSIPNMYEVKTGDTLYRISQMYQISVEEIQRLNKLSGTTISVGQILKLK